jgi:membrane protein required for colicin V production
MNELIINIFDKINLFDLLFSLILFYNIVQCFLKGFSLSLISFMKWVLSTIITIILFPKFQPLVGDYIDSKFINSVGLPITIFILTLFIIILVGKTLGRAITWTGVGSIDKGFGLLFGFFKGYIVSICLFSILNWFYPFQNWGIQIENAISFKIINNGSKILIEEFPSSEDFIDTKEKIEKI